MSSGFHKLLAFLSLLATIGLIVVGTLAMRGFVNDASTVEVLSQHPSILTPAAFTFSMWTSVFGVLLIFGIYQVLPSKAEDAAAVRPGYFLACIANIAWFVCWSFSQMAPAFVFICLTGLALFLVHRKLDRTGTFINALFVKGPLGLYFGWVTAMFLINAAIVLQSLLGEMSVAAWSTIGCLMLVMAIAAVFAVRVRWRNFIYPIGLAWAAMGIGIGQTGKIAVIMASALTIAACLLIAASIVVDLKGFGDE
ncbi:MAG: hypothetical protein HS105_04090 [Chloracidobacterium sp.]|nr:hypothetical protein [Chloracidobacterium sp.]